MLRVRFLITLYSFPSSASYHYKGSPTCIAPPNPGKGDGVYRDAPSIHNWLRCVLYNRRSKMNPLWNTIIVAGKTYSGKQGLGLALQRRRCAGGIYAFNEHSLKSWVEDKLNRIMMNIYLFYHWLGTIGCRWNVSWICRQDRGLIRGQECSYGFRLLHRSAYDAEGSWRLVKLHSNYS